MNNLGPSQAFDFYAHGVASGQSGLYTPFLGPAPREEKMSAYQQRSTAKFNMPKAYEGQNEVMGQTMEDYMLTAEWDWYTERIMPWYKTDQIQLQWSEWENNPHYMGITPHQAASRIVTQKNTIRKASIIRRGIACEFEHDFVSTALGRSSFMASLAQMARSVQETANVEVIRALLHCHHHQQVYIRKFGIVKDFELDEWLDRRANRFMCVQKDARGLEKLSTDIDVEQEMYQAKSDVWILGRALFDYTAEAHPEKTLYYLGGQEAVDRAEGRRKGTAAGGTKGNIRRIEPERIVHETPVFIVKSFHVEGIGKADLMSRVTEIGIYNKMIDRCNDYSRYTSDSRKIRVYDNDIDSWSDIELSYALQHCGIWNTAGELADVFSKGAGSRRNTSPDDEYDFLSHVVGGERQNIKYIGDMPLTHQTEQDLIDGGQTILNALTYGDANAARNLMDRFAKKDRKKPGAALKDHADLLTNLLGTDNFFHVTNQRDNASVNASIFEDVFCLGTAAATKSSATSSSTSSMSVPDMEKRFFTDAMGAALARTYHPQVAEIAGQTHLDWTERATSVKNLVLDVIAKDPAAVSALRNAQDVDAWHQKLVKGFAKKRDAQIAALQEGAGASADSEVEYFDVKSQLPAGYKWVNPELVNAPLIAHTNAYQAAAQQGAAPTQSQRFGRRANVGVPIVTGAFGDGYKGGNLAAKDQQFHNLNASITAINNASCHPLLKKLAILYAGSRFTRDRLVSFARANIAVKLGLLLLRPHCTYRTQFGIKCLSGGGAGYTFFGHSNMQIEHEAARKVGMAHYTAYISAVVLYPKNVYVVEDIYCEKYLGGMGVEFWKADDYKSNAVKRTSRSIICAPLPPCCKKIGQKIDARGRWYTEHRMNLVSEERHAKPHYDSAGRMNRLFGMHDESRKDRNVSRSKVRANFVCWQGMEWYYNDKVNRFDDYTVESGCMGEKVYPGCGKVRNGVKTNLKEPVYSTC
jgi:hypothetical protein